MNGDPRVNDGDPLDGPRALVFGLLGGFALWCVAFAIALACR